MNSTEIEDVKITCDPAREKIEGSLLYRNAALSIKGLKEFTK